MNPAGAPLEGLGYGPLFQVLFAAFALGALPGLAAVALLSTSSRTERFLWRLAAPGLGLFLFTSVLGIVVWTSGRYHPGLGHAVWLLLTAGIWAAARRRVRPG